MIRVRLRGAALSRFPLTPFHPIEALRAATEDDVAEALHGAWVKLPITTPAQGLELFNAVLDVLTGERDEAESGDAARIVDATRRAEG